MPIEALKELLKKAKIPFNKRKDQKPDLVEKALRSPTVMAMVEEEAIAQGEHIDGTNVDLETVEGNFVNIDPSMLVPPPAAMQTPVRRSWLPTNTGLSILTISPSGVASHTIGNPSVRAFAAIIPVSPDTL